MKNYNKIIIMFVMLLSIIGFGTIQNGTIANAATVGQQLKSPENGWQRIDDNDSKFMREDSGWSNASDAGRYKGNIWNSKSSGAKITFAFYGTKIRIIGAYFTNADPSRYITIDSESTTYTENGSVLYQAIVYEKTGLPLGVHTVTISGSTNFSLWLDAIDIDKDGYLLSPSIDIDESSVDLKLSDTEQLTVTTTPAGAEVVWSSSDESVATVENGKVTAHKEGSCTITATTTDENNLSDTCEVTVTKDVEPQPPTDPQGDGTLFIELVDGNIKSYDVTGDEIEGFIDWYKNRDLDDSESPIYKFNKGDYKDYVVHDKIDWFEVR